MIRVVPVPQEAVDKMMSGDVAGGFQGFLNIAQFAEVGQGTLDFGAGPLDANNGADIFVADTGNNRVLVFRAVSEFDELRLEPICSIDGLSAPWDPAKAIAAYEKACAGENMRACASLAAMLQNGRGVARDLARALTLDARACDGGNALACNNGGWLLNEAASGLPRDAERARRFYGRGCELENPAACVNLGSIFQHGQDVPVDLGRAGSLYETACRMGFETGCSLQRSLRGGAAPVRPPA